MLMKKLLAAFLICAALPLAAQATLVTLTASGTISSGFDNEGIFGGGADLSGKAFSQTFSIDTQTANRYTNAWMDQYYRDGAISQTKPIGKLSTTVDGHTYTIDMTEYGHILAFKMLSTLNHDYDMLTSSARTYSNNGTQYATFVMYVINYTNSFVGDTTVLDHVVAAPFTPSGNDDQIATFNLYDVDSNSRTLATTFRAKGNLLFELNAPQSSTDVPEPAGIALFALGFAGIVAARRRKPA